MKKFLKSSFSALLLLALAAGLLGLALGWWNSLFFKGWWTLFLIIPAVYSFINDGFNFFNSFLFLTGVALLLPHYFSAVKFSTAMYIICAVLLVVLAFRIILNPYIRKKKKSKFYANVNVNTGDAATVTGDATPNAAYSAKFSSKTVNYDGKEFNGTSLEVAFGTIKLDLRKAIITHDVDLYAEVKFGGLEVLMPENVGVVDKCNSTFGGVDIKNNINHIDSQYPKIILSGECSFGGIDIK